MHGTIGQARQASARHVLGCRKVIGNGNPLARHELAKGRGVGPAQDEIEHVDSVGPELCPEALAKTQTESLGRRIDSDARESAITGSRTDEDDAAPAARAHRLSEVVA